MQRLNLSGEKCPMALLKTKRWVGQFETGESAELIISSNGDTRDITRYLAANGFQITQQSLADNLIILHIKTEKQDPC